MCQEFPQGFLMCLYKQKKKKKTSQEFPRGFLKCIYKQRKIRRVKSSVSVLVKLVNVWYRMRRRHLHRCSSCTQGYASVLKKFCSVLFFDDPALSPYEVQHGCNKQTFQLVFVLSPAK